MGATPNIGVRLHLSSGDVANEMAMIGQPVYYLWPTASFPLRVHRIYTEPLSALDHFSTRFTQDRQHEIARIAGIGAAGETVTTEQIKWDSEPGEERYEAGNLR